MRWPSKSRRRCRKAPPTAETKPPQTDPSWTCYRSTGIYLWLFESKKLQGLSEIQGRKFIGTRVTLTVPAESSAPWPSSNPISSSLVDSQTSGSVCSYQPRWSCKNAKNATTCNTETLGVKTNRKNIKLRDIPLKKSKFHTVLNCLFGCKEPPKTIALN